MENNDFSERPLTRAKNLGKQLRSLTAKGTAIPQLAASILLKNNSTSEFITAKIDDIAYENGRKDINTTDKSAVVDKISFLRQQLRVEREHRLKSEGMIRNQSKMIDILTDHIER